MKMYFKNIFCYFPGTEVDHKQSLRIYLEKKKIMKIHIMEIQMELLGNLKPISGNWVLHNSAWNKE